MVLTLLASFGALLLGIIACSWAVVDHLILRRRLFAVRRHNLELQQTLRHQGDLSKEVAHELKNPITAVVCAAEVLELLLDDKLDETNRSMLRHIKEYGQHVLELMQDFMDLSSGLCGQLKCEKQLVVLGETARTVSGLLEPSAGRKEILFVTEGFQDELCASIDPKHLKQIVFNLLHNSVKFTPQGGQINVRTWEKPETERVFLSVSDTGVGISAADLADIFSPVRVIRRGHAKRITGAEHGAGLGLPLTKTLTEIEGGDFEIKSELGIGTTVTVSFPRVAAAAKELIELVESVESVQPFAGQAVLLVDSDPGVRDIVSRLIETLGGAVDGVSMALDAVQALRHKNYTVVMIDESADGLQGCELAQLLRQDPATRNTRIVVASSKPIDQAMAKDSGADQCIEKPLNSQVLIDSLLQTH